VEKKFFPKQETKMNNQNRKTLWNAEKGDLVRIGKKIYSVTKILKTQLRVRQVSEDTFALKYDDKYPKIHVRNVRKDTGTVVGSGSGYHKNWAHIFQNMDEVNEFIAGKEKARAEQKARQKEKEDRQAAKQKAMRDANPNFASVIDSFGRQGLRTTEFVNGDGSTGTIIFSVKQTEIYNWENHENVPGYKVQASVFCVSWANHEKSFHSRDLVEGETVKEILWSLVERYWVTNS
jgi:hypothetical protein